MSDFKSNPDFYEQSKKYGRQLLELISSAANHPQKHPPEAPGSAAAAEKSTASLWLSALYAYPYLLLAVFVISFFWDFEGSTFTFRNTTISLEGLLRILSISGLIGFLTNWLAITMLFRPVHRRPLMGQGLVPSQKKKIAERLARAVSEDLINPELIRQQIETSGTIPKYRELSQQYISNLVDDAEFREEIRALLLQYARDVFGNEDTRLAIAEALETQINKNLDSYSVEKIALKAYTLLKGREFRQIAAEALLDVPGHLEVNLDKIDDVIDSLPAKIADNSAAIEKTASALLYKLISLLDVYTLVEENLKKYDEKEMERLIKNASNEQLRYIQYLGAILGTFGGFVIWKPIPSLLFLTAGIALIFTADLILKNIIRT